MVRASKSELIGRFCKVDWCSQFFLAKPKEYLCKKCRKKQLDQVDDKTEAEYAIERRYGIRL